MPYNENLVNRIREALVEVPQQIEEKEMFQGLVFMVNDKMCMGVRHEEMLCRIDPALTEACLERGGCRQMSHGKRMMRGYLFVNETGYQRQQDFEYWIGLCLAFNPHAKRSVRRKK